MSDSRVRIWFSLFVLAVFCVGLAGGVLTGRLISRRVLFDRGFDRGAYRGPDFGPGGRGRGGPPPDVLAGRLTQELDLTPDQRARVETVLKESRARIEALQREVGGRFEAERQQLRDEIRHVLTPEQQPRFDRWDE